MRAVQILLLLPIILAQHYRYLTFIELSNRIHALKNKYPNLIKVETAQELYNLPYPDCGNVRCDIYIVTLTDHTTTDASRPEVFISGAVHGNEVLGPNVAIYLLEYLVENYNKDNWITYLINNRRLVVMPAANSQGYYYNRREEVVGGVPFDPNRDFPYDSQPSKCLNTVSGRAVFYTIADHMFVIGITFHGGDAVISYPWGSTNHMVNNRAEESPDHAAMEEVAAMLREVAGNYPSPFKLGTMTDTVYAVNGGLEDWAYAASWAKELEGNTLVEDCYGEFSSLGNSRVLMNDDNVRFPLYLIETDHNKHPNEVTWGRKEGINQAAGNGHIPRNIRMSMAIMDMAEPYIRDIQAIYHNATHLDLRWKVGGSLFVNETYVEWSYSPGIQATARPYIWLQGAEVMEEYSSFLFRTASKHGPGYWTDPKHYFSAHLPIENLASVNYTIRIAAIADQQWGRQGNPRPQSPPLTHFARMRLDRNYVAQSGSSAISTNVVFHSPSFKIKSVVVPARLDATAVLLIVIAALIVTLLLAMCVRLYVFFKDAKQGIPVAQSETQADIAIETQEEISN